jgi:hypothetical protein
MRIQAMDAFQYEDLIFLELDGLALFPQTSLEVVFGQRDFLAAHQSGDIAFQQISVQCRKDSKS